MTERRAIVAALVAVLTAGCGGEAASVPAGARPAVVAKDTRAIVAWLGQQRGKPVLVNFWATWCAPCLAELPDLLEGTRAFRARGGVVLGVAMEQMGLDLTDEQAVAKAGAKAKQLDLDFPNFVCTDDDMIRVREILGVELGGLPQTLTYDREGRLVAQHEGMATAERFAAMASEAER